MRQLCLSQMHKKGNSTGWTVDLDNLYNYPAKEFNFKPTGDSVLISANMGNGWGINGVFLGHETTIDVLLIPGITDLLNNFTYIELQMLKTVVSRKKL